VAALKTLGFTKVPDTLFSAFLINDSFFIIAQPLMEHLSKVREIREKNRLLLCHGFVTFMVRITVTTSCDTPVGEFIEIISIHPGGHGIHNQCQNDSSVSSPRSAMKAIAAYGAQVINSVSGIDIRDLHMFGNLRISGRNAGFGPVLLTSTNRSAVV
jgi:hypothetical protein